MLTACLSNAVADIQSTMVGRVYPNWSNRAPNFRADAMCSTGGPPAPVIVTPAILGEIPAVLHADATALAPQWKSNAVGRFAYAVVNVSGLLDANVIGKWPQQWFTNASELPLGGLSEISDTNLFVSERIADGEYTSISDLTNRNAAVSMASSLFTTSYDPAPDQLFFTQSNPPADWASSGAWVSRVDTRRPIPLLGQPAASTYLGSKFAINGITNYTVQHLAYSNLNAYLSDVTFLNGYFKPLTNLVARAVPNSSIAGRCADIGWNIVNYLDRDRLPHCGDSKAWLRTVGGEAMPLINEIVIEPVSLPGGTGYVLRVELWYPFAPLAVTPSDGYNIQLMIFDNPGSMTAPGGVSELNIASLANPAFKPVIAIPSMAFGSTQEFMVVSTDPYTFPTNASSAGQYGGLGYVDAATKRTNCFFMLARVNQVVSGQSIPVDEAMGYENGSANPGKRQLFRVTKPWGYGVNDPRANGQVKYWMLVPPGSEIRSNGGDYNWTLHTLGTTNSRATSPFCDPAVQGPFSRGEGVPIYATNGVMANIAELGRIYQSALVDEMPPYPSEWHWRNLNIMNREQGSLLLDMMTSRTPSISAVRQGCLAIGTHHTNAWKSFFHNLSLGAPGNPGFPVAQVPQEYVNLMISMLMATNCTSFYDLFTSESSSNGGGGDTAVSMRECAEAVDRPSDYYAEDILRQLCELVSFRQNLFLVAMVRDAFGFDERRALVLVARDAYTGNVKYLTDTNFAFSIVYAATNGLHVPPFETWQNAATNLQTAVDAAGEFGRINVGPGTFALPDTLSITSAVSVISTAGFGRTILDAQNLAPCVAMQHPGARLSGVTVTRGLAPSSGGGVQMIQGGRLDNALIIRNRAGLDGGGIAVPYNATALVANCTIRFNTADENGGGIDLKGPGSTVVNSIILDNQALGNSSNWMDWFGGSFFYCDTAPLPAGPGNQSSNPFLSPQHRLTEDSPCMDSGTGNGAPSLDSDQEPRWDHPTNGPPGGVVDIGADEFVDLELDGLPDAWERAVFGNTTTNGRLDGDSDKLENFREFAAGTDFADADSDDDSLPDGWEVRYNLQPLDSNGVNGADGDMDGDHFPNRSEYIASTDPQSAASLLTARTIAVGSNLVSLQWTGGTSSGYRVEFADVLSGTGTSWQIVTGALILYSGNPTWSTPALPAGTNGQRYFRVNATRL